MGVREVLAAIVLLAPLAGPAEGVADIYAPEPEDCVRRAGISEYTPVARRGDYVVLGNRRTRDAAERSDRIIRDERFWTFYSSRYDLPPRDPAPGGGFLPLQIFVTNEDIDAAGTVLAYCEAPTESDVVLVAADLEGVELRATLAHELFHAFSDGESAPQFVEGWWAEATATWAEVKLAPSEAQIRRLDNQFIQRPLVPLDRELPDTAWDERQYGAWRFIEWLSLYLGGESAVWELMGGTFRRIAAGVTGTVALQKELEAEGRDLGEDLGHFWGDRLRPTNPLGGPASEGRTDGFPTDDPAGSGELTETKELTAKRLAADVVRLKMPPSSHVQRITVTADRAPAGTYLWVQNGRELEDWTGGDSASFCVGGFSPATDAKAWPGRLPVAFTNGNVEPSSPPLTHTLRITVSAEECDGFVPDRSAAIDESPVVDLPDRCPDEPADFPPPDPHTGYFVFRERFQRIYISLSNWIQASVAEVLSRDLSQRRAGRLLARWYYCAARRASRIRELPVEASGDDDRLIDRWRDDWVRLTRRAASMLERGQIREATEAFGDAAKKLIKITTRCTFQDIATGEGASG